MTAAVPPRPPVPAAADLFSAASAAPDDTARAVPVADDSAAAALHALQHARDAGRLRAVDLALARLLHALDPAAPGSLLRAAAWVSWLEGQGHSGLPLDAAERVRLAAAGAGLPPDEAPASDAPSAGGVSGSAWPSVRCAGVDGPGAGGPPLPDGAAAALAAWGRSPLVDPAPALSIGSPVGTEPASADVGVSAAGPAGRGATPLVLAGGRLALRRQWQHEARLAAALRRRVQPLPDAALPDPARVRNALAGLFQAPSDAARGAAAPDWQQAAAVVALRSRLLLLTGGPGTGKTWTAARILLLLQRLHDGPAPLRVALAAPTGKAATRLRQSLDAALAGVAGADRDAAHAQPLPARTLHALLGTRSGTRAFVHDAANPLPLDLLFVDEASMVHLEMMDALLDALPPQARLVLLGDPDQLASVEAGAVLADLCQAPAAAGRAGHDDATARWALSAGGVVLPREERGGGSDLAQQTVRLRRSRRFDGPIGALAAAVQRGDAAGLESVLTGARADAPVWIDLRADALRGPGGAALALHGRALAAADAAADGAAATGWAKLFRRLAEHRAERADPADRLDFAVHVSGLLEALDDFRILCALREGPWGVAGLNAAVESALAAAGLLPDRGAGPWYEGRPVLVTRNDPALGLFNGDVGLVLRPPPAAGAAPGTPPPLRAWFPDGRPGARGARSVAVSRLADVETAFAMTVHKSQGSEFGHVLLVLPDADAPVLTREWLYTGITRARHALTLAGPDPALLAAAVARRTLRRSGLQALLEPPAP